MEQDRKAVIFLSLSIFASLYIFLTLPFDHLQGITFILVEVLGLLFIVWSLIAKRVNIEHTDHKLPPGYFWVSKGPYEVIRHPIYAGYLLIMSSLVQNDFTFLRTVAFIVLVVAILLKIIREEDTMEREIKAYKDYKSKTNRLIPFLF